MLPADTEDQIEPKAFEVTNRMVFAIAAPMTLAFLTTPLLGLVDIAVAGRLGDASLIGGLAISAVLFDLVFSVFNFFRASTTGLVAQAVGRRDRVEQQAIFWRALIAAVIAGLLVILAGPVLLWLGLKFMAPQPDVAIAATAYLSIRVISTPAALANYVFLGQLLGEARSGLGLLLQTIINGTNIVLSIWFGLGLGWGLEGIAWATVTAEVVGCVAGLSIIMPGFRGTNRPAIIQIFDTKALRSLLALNIDIMIRTLALIFAFAWFTRLGAAFGELQLAANAILMNLFLVASYYLDGLATAAEQIAGRAIGARHRPAFVRAVRLTIIWGFVLAVPTTAFFLFFGDGIIALLTTVEPVRQAASTYLPWAAVTAISGVLAFQMDGVFIGATWSRDMRNMMLLSLALFVACTHFLGQSFGNHGLWAALNIFLASRGFGLLAVMPKRMNQIFGTAESGMARPA